MSQYIFCPLCGEHKWSIDKSRNIVDTMDVTINKCSTCQKFIYTEILKCMRSENDLIVIYKDRYSEEVTCGKYNIYVNYSDNFTEIRVNWSLVLNINQAVNFNWYNKDALKEKIRKLLVFS